jgi:hypothetical protein
MNLQSFAIGLAFLGVFVANLLWYRLKFLLRDRGYPVSWFQDHFQDFRHLDDLIVSSGSSPDVQRLRRLRILIYTAVSVTLAAFFLLVASHFLRT